MSDARLFREFLHFLIQGINVLNQSHMRVNDLAIFGNQHGERGFGAAQGFVYFIWPVRYDVRAAI